LGYAVLAMLTLYLVLRYILLADSDHVGSSTGRSGIEGPQDIVLVTVFDEEVMSQNYIRMVRTNRNHYAAKHGMTIKDEPEVPDGFTN